MKNEANSRSSVWVTAILIFLIAIAGIFIAAKFYTDWLWYQSLDATQVFATRLLAQLGIFLAFFLVMAATLAFSLAIASSASAQVENGPSWTRVSVRALMPRFFRSSISFSALSGLANRPSCTW